MSVRSKCHSSKKNANTGGLVLKIRRKAEEDRLRKEEEKTRRELIKQDYLRRKQQEIFEEQGLVKPKTPKAKPKSHRPKSVFREESSSDTLSKCSSSTRKIVTSISLTYLSTVCIFCFLQMSCGAHRLTATHFLLYCKYFHIALQHVFRFN